MEEVRKVILGLAFWSSLTVNTVLRSRHYSQIKSKFCLELGLDSLLDISKLFVHGTSSSQSLSALGKS